MIYRKIHLNQIHEGYSPRKDFTGQEELKGSIEKDKLLEPILVRKDTDKYIVIDGIMRLRVVKELGWKEITCNMLDVDEEKSYHITYIKNTQRKNLTPIEDALHLQTVKEKFGYNHEDLVKLGYAPHRSTLDDKIGLLTLPETIQNHISEGSVIGPSIGYALLELKDADLQVKLAEEIIARGGMPVRKVKDKVKSLNVSRRRHEEEKEPHVKIPKGEIPGVFIKDSSDMSELKDESVGLIVTSPPYGVGLEYEKDVTFEKHMENLEIVFSECVRVLKSGGKIGINFGDIQTFGTRTNGKPEIQLMGHVFQKILRKHNVRLIDTIIWKKCTKGKRDFNWSSNPQANYHDKKRHTTYRIINNTEYIHVFEKDGERDVSLEIEDASRVSKEEYDEWNDGVWEIHPVQGKKGHPAPFPEEIPRRFIKLYSYIGDIVLDPFGGSMTTVKVANELGRVGIGYERKKEYKSAIMEKLGIKIDDLKKEDPQFEVVKEIEILQESVKNDSTISKEVIEETEDCSVSDDYIENTEIEQDTEEQEPSKMTAKLIDLTDYPRGSPIQISTLVMVKEV